MKTLVLSLLIAVASMAHAQEFKFAPKWQLGKSIYLEHIYSNYEKENDGTVIFDTSHVDVKMILVKEDESFYFFDWWFISYYQDTLKVKRASEKLLDPIIDKCVKPLPIMIKVEKANWKVQVINQAALDSLRSKVIKEWIAKGEQDDIDRLAEGLSKMSAAMKMGDKLNRIITKYFAVYSEDVLELNRRTSLEEIQKLKNIDIDVSEAYSKMDMDGYAILDDTHAQYYLYHWQAKMDMSKMMTAFAEMLKGGTEKEDKKKRSKKVKKKSLPTLNSTPPDCTTITLDIKVSKLDMTFISSTEIMGGCETSTGEKGRSTEILRIKP